MFRYSIKANFLKDHGMTVHNSCYSIGNKDFTEIIFITEVNRMTWGELYTYMGY